MCEKGALAGKAPANQRLSRIVEPEMIDAIFSESTAIGISVLPVSIIVVSRYLTWSDDLGYDCNF